MTKYLLTYEIREGNDVKFVRAKEFSNEKDMQEWIRNQKNITTIGMSKIELNGNGENE